MEKEINIMKSLTRLDELCSAGYAIALHISYSASRFLFQTYNQEWRKVYTDLGLVLKDPTVRWGFENSGIVQWDTLREQDEFGVLEQAAKYGIRHGFTLAIANSPSRSIASFARDDRIFNDEESQEIHTIVSELHDYTEGLDDFPKEELAHLKSLSVVFTQG